MLLLDANVLLYAVNEDALQHERARDWLRKALAEREPIGFAWPVMLAFLRIATHPAITDAPIDTETAANMLERWLSSPTCVVVEPTSRHLALLRGLLAVAGTGGNLVNDAHLAALALEHDATVISFDRDFERFAGSPVLPLSRFSR